MSLPDPQYDIIFAGGSFTIATNCQCVLVAYSLLHIGGAAGCLTAGRLAAADPTLKILIIEAGPSTKNEPNHVQPARFITHLTPDSKTMKYMVANSSKFLDGRNVVAPAAQCLGGGSSVNCTSSVGP